MTERVLARQPVQTNTLNFTSSPVGTSAWVEVTDELDFDITAIEIFNPSSAFLNISVGALGDEDDYILPYTIFPGGPAVLLPINLAEGDRISIKAITGSDTANSSIFGINYLG